MMSCFFCQSLLSDYIDGLLPSARSEEVSCHLKDCSKCRHNESELKQLREILAGSASPGLSHELSLRIAEAIVAGHRKLDSSSISSRVLVVSIAFLIILGSVIWYFPGAFLWIRRLSASDSGQQFIRYYPLLQGADEIVEEQLTWFQAKEPFMRSLWEEGGLSPEEFEKAFTPNRQNTGQKDGEPQSVK